MVSSRWVRCAAAIGLTASRDRLTGLGDRPSWAELIYFRKGGEVQLPATVEGNRVILSLPDRKVELLPQDIRKRVPGFWPGAEWGARCQQARAGGFATRYA